MTALSRHIRPPHCRRGFTLIETIAAVVVLAIAMPALLWALRDATSKRADPVLLSRARWLAAERLNDAIADRNSSTRGYAYVVNANYPAENPVSGFAKFNRSVNITESGPNLVAGSGTGYKTVVVTVAYNDGRNVARTFTLSTILTNYTP